LIRNWRLLIFAFLLLNAFTWVTWAEYSYGIPQIVKYILSLSVLAVLILYAFTYPSRMIHQDGFSVIFYWFFGYSAYLLIASIFNFNALIYIQRTFADRTFFLPYLIPLIVLLIKFDISFFLTLFRYAVPLMFLVLFVQLFIFAFELSPANWLEQFERINLFNIGSSFLILISHFSRRKYVSAILILHYILFIILALVYGRRGGAISGLLLLLFMIFLRLRSPLINIKKRVAMYIMGLLLVVIVFSFGYLLQSTYAFERGFSKDAFEESRGAVFRDFHEDFTSASDWIFGRGIMGRVYRSFYSGGSLDIVEQGFLTVILRGGLLYLIPFVLIFFRAIYLGFFKSNNDMIKALSILVFLHILLMFYFNLPDYSTYYVFIWIAIGACYNPNLRAISNADFYKAINSVDRKCN